MHEIHLINIIIILLFQYALPSQMKSEKRVFDDFTTDETVHIYLSHIYIYVYYS
jgi:hypothetical protein